MKRAVPLLLLWLCLAAGSLVATRAHSGLEARQPLTRWQDALLDLLGGGRTVLARLLWFTMDVMHEQEEELGHDAFRETELVPLMRMVTFLDPQLWEAYDTLAYDLDRGYSQRSKALALIDEGLRYNPEQFDLLYRRADLTTRQGRWGRAVPFYLRAMVAAGQEQSGKEFVDKTEIHKMSVLRGLIHCAERMQDPVLGLRTLSALESIHPGNHLYDAQRARWLQEEQQPES